MGKIRLTLACWDYDRTRALQEGRVEVEGVDLTYLPLRVEETFWRMLRYGEFDAAELSTGSYLMARDKGAPKLIAIPVFPSKTFRHSCIYINTDSGIKKPADMAGKRVGVPEYQITMAIWARGILQHEYGVSPDKMKWFTGGEEQPGREDKVKHDLPADHRYPTDWPGQDIIVDVGERRDRRHDLGPHAVAVRAAFPQSAEVDSKLPRSGRRLLPPDQNLPDHAHGGLAGGSLRKASVGRPELVQGVCRVKTNLPGSHVRVLGAQIYDGMVY